MAVALLVALFFAVDCALKASRAASISDEASCSEEAYRRYIERLVRWGRGFIEPALRNFPDAIIYLLVYSHVDKNGLNNPIA